MKRLKPLFQYVVIFAVMIAAGMYLNGQGYFAGSNWLFDSCTDLYGQAASRVAVVHVLWSFPMRSGVLQENDIQSMANSKWVVVDYKQPASSEYSSGLRVLPETPDILDFNRVIKSCAQQNVDVLVESSGMDAWHTSRTGWQALHSMRARTLRTVIFDGGHHLPTLGIQPDLILVPDTMGYAAHGYMKDAVLISKLQEIARRESLPFTIVTVSRWGLVKTSDSMSRITCEALAKTSLGDKDVPVKGHVLAPHFTQWGSAAFVYIDNVDQIIQIKEIVDQNESIKRIYAAFNYSKLGLPEVKKCRRSLSSLGIEVEIVNESLNVPAVITQEVF
ncbi:MAG: hypothetical protein ACM3UZ_00440 [Acidobacteriota bacterium]